jgi:hypothetical protein
MSVSFSLSLFVRSVSLSLSLIAEFVSRKCVIVVLGIASYLEKVVVPKGAHVCARNQHDDEQRRGYERQHERRNLERLAGSHDGDAGDRSNLSCPSTLRMG